MAKKSSAGSFLGPKAAGPYLEALYENGLFLVTGKGAIKLDPCVEALVKGIHSALAGGEVDVKVRKKGNAATIRDLNAKLAKALKSTNLLKADMGPGTYVP